LVKQETKRLVTCEELAVAAPAEKLAVEKEEAMDEAYMRVGMHVTRGVRLASVVDNPDSAAVAGASVSLAVRRH
jgi:hypothetical protein